MIEITNLSKKYKGTSFNALDNINLSIGTGMFGLLGNNGAGKTTLMNIIATLLAPTNGSIVIEALELCPANYTKIKRLIGYMPQENEVYPDMTVAEMIEYFSILNKIEYEKGKQVLQDVLGYVNLFKERKKKCGNLSGGMKRRLCLALALINDPPILIVDEPTTGVDPYERIRMRELLMHLSRTKTVIVSTHIIEDISYLCHNLAVLDGGKLLFEGNIQSMLKIANEKIWLYRTTDLRKVEDIKRSYTILGITIEGRDSKIKLYASERPSICVESIKPTLEDAYIVLGEERSNGKHNDNGIINCQ